MSMARTGRAVAAIALTAAAIALISTSLFGDLQRFFLVTGLFGLLVIALAVFALPPMLASERGRNLLIGMTVAAFACVVTLGVGEVLSRWYSADVATTASGGGFFGKRWKEENPIALNRFGFREREFSQEAEAGVYRIAVIGDSLTYGQGIKDDERLTSLLEERLNANSRQHEVLNFGWSGHETEHQLETLKDLVLPLDPDFLLLQWFPNDVEGKDKSARPRPPNLIPSKRVHNWLSDNSALYSMTHIGFHQLLRRLGLYPSYQTYLTERFQDPESPQWKDYEQVLRDFMELTRAEELPLGVYLYPLQGSKKIEDYSIGYLHDRVLNICAAYEIKCLDLRARLAEVEDPSKLAVSRYDGHPSAYANEIMTEEVLEAFKDDWTKGDWAKEN